MASETDDASMAMEEVHSYPAIWDKFCSDFKNKHKKVNAFTNIGLKISISAEEEVKKYNSIRTMYVRYTKRKPSDSVRLSVNPIYEALSIVVESLYQNQDNLQ